ncbi:MAG: hypothetical protein FIO03_06280 [Nitrosopumilales archaeon]|nr:hypothetical protein [Nitrosopumilales archaeon]
MTHIFVSTEAKGIPKTEIVRGSGNVVDCLVQFMCKAKLRIDVCVDHTRPYLAIEIIRLRDAFIDAKRRHITIRYITEITKDNLRYCKELISLVDELRHLNGIKGNFYVSEQEYAAPSTLHEEGKSSEMMIYSNVKEIVEHQQYIFDSFWNTSTSVERKIREIQSDISLGITEIIDNPLRTQELFINLVKSAKSEVLLILPTVNAFMREHRIGIIELFKELSTTPETTTQRRKSVSALATSVSEDNQEKEEEERRAINIRILTPTNEAIDKIIEEMKVTTTISTTSVSKQESIFPLSLDNDSNAYLKIRHLGSQPEFNVTTVTILVVDRKASLVIEKVDDSKESFIEAVGLSTYSTSEPTITSYFSIFENFWNQLELYEKLKEHDKMQKEFINIAAHELRTPTQSILGYAEILEMESEGSRQLVNPIIRNAIRLQRLTGDILDVTRIESQTLRLHKEEFNLNELISTVIQDCKSQIDSEKIKLVYEHRSVNNIIVNADKNRLNQVISNLISNSIKFTQGEWGIISITTKKEQDNKAITISVKDTGKGIDPEIIPRLFTKFATKSETGTGLGLFISKSIVEAHGGRIWAENNKDGKGATFYFTLPVSKLP